LLVYLGIHGIVELIEEGSDDWGTVVGGVGEKGKPVWQ
jgi:hypothetical protein